jgi:hypothetical protein
MSTSINDLPGIPFSFSANQPAQQTPQQMPQQIPQQQMQSPPPTGHIQSFDPNVINQLMDGINEAYIKGETVLPTRDIPQHINPIDEQVIPNYIPPEEEKYMEDGPTHEDIIAYHDKKAARSKTTDTIYNEMQTPILLCALYFMFQLPIFRKTMLSFFPFMFAKDGNSNVTGYFGFSLLFGIVFYILNKLVIWLNKF